MAKITIFLLLLIVIGKLSNSVTASDSWHSFGLNFEPIIHSLNVGGLAMAVVQNQSYYKAQGFGDQDLLGSLMTNQTGFFIGSLTKAFTATLAVVLAKKHGIDLKDNVNLFYGLNIATPEQENTNLIDLLAHRVGAGSYEFFWLTHGTQEGTNVLENPLTNKIEVVHQGFRSEFIFSSLMYWVVGEALEAIVSNKTTEDESDEEADRSWCDLVTQFVINELEMNETTCEWRDSGRDGIGGLMATQLLWNGTNLEYIPTGIADQWQNVLAASGMISSANDMVNWLRFNLKLRKYGNLNETIDITHRMYMGIENSYGMKLSEFGISFHTYGYGLGWYLANYRGFQVLYHDGRLLGHQNLVWLIPEIEFGVYLAGTGGTNDTIQQMMLIAMYLTDRFSGGLTEPWLNESILINWKNLHREELYYPPTQPHTIEPLSTCNCLVNGTRVRYCEQEYLYFELSNNATKNEAIKPANYTNEVYGSMLIASCSEFIPSGYVPSKPSTEYCMQINKFIGEIQPTNLTNIYNLKPHGQFTYIHKTVFQRPLLVKISSESTSSVFTENVEVSVCGLTLDPRVPPHFIRDYNQGNQAIATLPIVFVILAIFLLGITLNSHKTIRRKIDRYILSRMPYKMSINHQGIKIEKQEKISLLLQDHGNLTEHQRLVADICKPKPKKEASINKEDEEMIFKGVKSSKNKYEQLVDEELIESIEGEKISAVVQTRDTTIFTNKGSEERDGTV